MFRKDGICETFVFEYADFSETKLYFPRVVFSSEFIEKSILFAFVSCIKCVTRFRFETEQGNRRCYIVNSNFVTAVRSFGSQLNIIL